MPLRSSLQRKTTAGRWPSASLRRREALSVNMISLPLGDFRHLSHVARGNHRDSFGDLSFLQRGQSLILKTSKSEDDLLQSCAPPPKPPRLSTEVANEGGSPDWTVGHRPPPRQRLRSSSLPLLDSEDREDLAFEEVETESIVGRDSLGSGGETDSLQASLVEAPPQQDDSAFIMDMDLDLGPSILDEVLQVMDRFHQ